MTKLYGPISAGSPLSSPLFLDSIPSLDVPTQVPPKEGSALLTQAIPMAGVAVVAVTAAAVGAAAIYFSQDKPEERARVLRELGDRLTTQFGAFGQDLKAMVVSLLAQSRTQAEFATALVSRLLPNASPEKIAQTVGQALQQAAQPSSPPSTGQPLQLSRAQAEGAMQQLLFQNGVTQPDYLAAVTRRYADKLLGNASNVNSNELEKFKSDLSNSPQLNSALLLQASVDVLQQQGRLGTGAEVQQFTQQLKRWLSATVEGLKPADERQIFVGQANKLGWLVSDSPQARELVEQMVQGSMKAPSPASATTPKAGTPGDTTASKTSPRLPDDPSKPPKLPGSEPTPPIPPLRREVQTPLDDKNLKEVNDQDPQKIHERWLEQMQRAKEEADAIIRRHNQTVRLRPQTPDEVEAELNAITDPAVRNMARGFWQFMQYRDGFRHSDGSISFDMAWHLYEQSVRDGEQWFRNHGVDLAANPPPSAQRLAEALHESQMLGEKVSGLGSDAWSALLAWGRANEVQAVLQQAQEQGGRINEPGLTQHPPPEEVARTIQGIGSFEALSDYLRRISTHPEFQSWVDDKNSVFLRAVEEAFLRLDRRQGVSGFPVFTGETGSLTSKRQWDALEYERFAKLVLNLGDAYFRALPVTLVDHLATHVLYRFSLETYQRGVAHRQTQMKGEEGQDLDPLHIAPDLAPAIRLLRRAQTAPHEPQPTPTPLQTPQQTKILDGLGQPMPGDGPLIQPLGTQSTLSPLLQVGAAKVPADLYTLTGMNPLKTHALIGDLHGNSDLLLQLLNTLAEEVRSGHMPQDTVVVFLGDYINKGADPAGVVQIVQLLTANAEGQRVELPKWLEQSGFQRTLDVLNEIQVVRLRGNHEDPNSFAIHMSATADMNAYSQRVSEMLGKGLDHTVTSYLVRRPELFSGPDRAWLAQAISHYPVPPKSGHNPALWHWNDGGELTAQQATEFYQNFQRIWVGALQASGDLGFYAQLKSAYTSGDVNAMHGGPPMTAEGMEKLWIHLKHGTPLPLEIEKEILWRRYTAETNSFEAQAAQTWKAQQRIGEAFPPNTFTGHTMGGNFDFESHQQPDGSPLTIQSVGLDLGFGLNNLGMGVVKPNGEALLFIGSREREGIKVDATGLEELNRHGPELPNRFPKVK